MRYLVTGGAGFLGTALSNRLARQGHEVLVLDDASAGYPDRLLPEVKFVRGDINDKMLLWTLLPGVDCVFTWLLKFPSRNRSFIHGITTQSMLAAQLL